VVKVALDEEIRAITPGQSAVIYDGPRVIGGGIVV
jgi:tRNA U34 2-thiouridine synthase MnmA/TrmU